MDELLFKNFEKLNILFDMWIDQEEYDTIKKCIILKKKINEDKTDKFTDYIFESIRHGHCINQIKNYDDDILYKNNSSIADSDIESWVILLYSKYLRSRLQCMRTDSHAKLLDILVTFIEKNLPEEHGNDYQKKLFFYFLMELSSTSLKHEQLGYAFRAKRYKEKYPYIFKVENNKLNIYDVWIMYNRGIAYRHTNDNDKAILEFSSIIEEFKKSAEDKDITDVERSIFYYKSYLQIIYTYIDMQAPYDAYAIFKNNILKDVSKLTSYVYFEFVINLIKIFLMSGNEKYAIEYYSILTSRYKNRFPKCIDNKKGIFELKSIQRCEEDHLSEDKTRILEIALSSSINVLEGRIYKSYELNKIDVLLMQNIIREKGNNGLHQYIKNKYTDQNILIKEIEKIYKWVAETNSLLASYKNTAINNSFDAYTFFDFSAFIAYYCLRILKEISEIKNKCLALHTKYLKIAKVSLANILEFPIFKDGSSQYYNFHIEFSRIINGEKCSPETFHEIFSKYDEIIKIIPAFSYEEFTKSKDKFYSNYIADERKSSNLAIALFGIYQKIHSIREDIPFDNAYINNFCEEKYNHILSHKDYNYIMHQHYEKFLSYLKQPSHHNIKTSRAESFNNTLDNTKNIIHFLCLRRWNSITPAEGMSIGGGYFIYRTNSAGNVDLGIAIDPGFDFIRNLFKMGFSLYDIDIVLISHIHLDHIRDFESIVHLLHEIKEKQITIFISSAAYDRLKHIITNPNFIYYLDTVVYDSNATLDDNYFSKLGPNEYGHINFSYFMKENTDCDIKEYKLRWEIEYNSKEDKNDLLKISPTRAYHDDYSNISDSFGFIVEVPQLNHDGTINRVTFGYTGDTKTFGTLYDDSTKTFSGLELVTKQYENCDVLLAHMGSLIDHKKGDKLPGSCDGKKLIMKKNHPYLPGIMMILDEYFRTMQRDRLFLLGEFGEEFKGMIRVDLIKRLMRCVPNLTKNCLNDIIPIDVGLDIITIRYQDGTGYHSKFLFYCSICECYHSIDRIDYITFGPDEALFYLCSTCKKSMPQDVIYDKLRRIYDLGYTLTTY